jgi:hypothetical protein
MGRLTYSLNVSLDPPLRRVTGPLTASAPA